MFMKPLFMRLAGAILMPAALFLMSCPAHAGLQLQLDLVHNGIGNTYQCNVGVSLTADPPDVTPTSFHEIISPNADFYGGVGTGASNYSQAFTGDYDGMMQEITNGQWRLIMNVGTPSEDTYYFTVSNLGVTSNLLGNVTVIYPANGASVVSGLPDFQWQGPAGAGGLGVFVYNPTNPAVNRSIPLNPAVTNSTLPPQLPAGEYSFNVDYTRNFFSALVPGTPMDSMNNPAPGWGYRSVSDSESSCAFTVLPPLTYTLPEALDATNVTWTTSGDALWFPETTNTADGISAAESGPINAQQSSTLQTTLTGPAYITFWWQTVDDDGDFYLNFNIDGLTEDVLNGAADWTSDGPFTVGPGQHTFQWVASADNTGTDSPTNDAAYVGDVTIAPLPTLQFSADVLAGTEPLTVHFSSPTNDSAGNLVTNRTWDFGDGSQSTAQNPTHIYTQLGSFQPSLAAESSNVPVPLLVYGVGFITVTNPAVHYTATPSSGTSPLKVQFASDGTDSVGNTVTNWSWLFGDGTGSAVQSPSHIYTNLGRYAVTLTTRATGVSLPENGQGPAAVTVLRPSVFTNLPGPVHDFTFNNFSNTSSLQFNGSAEPAITTDGAVLELTPSSLDVAGSAFIATAIPFGHYMGFSTFFMFRLHNPGGIAAADGITFTLQGVSPYNVGSAGGGLGYEGISNSLSIEFDTYNNLQTFGPPGDINSNHVAINLNGGLNDPISADVTNGYLGDGNVWYAWIDYEGVSGDLEVRVSEAPVRPLIPTLDCLVSNLPALLGSTNAYVGFTASTGSGTEQQDILAWKFIALPTTVFTGNFNLTNFPAGFLIRNGVVLDEFRYTVAGLRFTNYTYAQAIVTSNGPGQFAYATKLGDFSPDALDDVVNSNAAAIDAAERANAMALDKLDADLNRFTMLAAYNSSTSPEDGVLLNTYNSDSGFPEFMQNAAFDTVFPGYQESDTVSILDQINPNPPPGLFPPPQLSGLAAGAATGAAAGAADSQLFSPPDPGGDFSFWTTTFSSGVVAGNMTARQQVVYSPPLPLQILSPRSDGTNFMFNFVTVSNQSYTVWQRPNLASSTWQSYTNVIGAGYVQAVTTPLTNSPASFFRLSSP